MYCTTFSVGNSATTDQKGFIFSCLNKIYLLAVYSGVNLTQIRILGTSKSLSLIPLLKKANKKCAHGSSFFTFNLLV